MITAYDSEMDVLYVRDTAVRIKTSKAAPHDDGLIIDYTLDGTVVGCVVLHAKGFTKESWQNHTDRSMIPDTIRNMVDVWMEANL